MTTTSGRDWAAEAAEREAATRVASEQSRTTNALGFDLSRMSDTKNVEHFPYWTKYVSWILISRDGTVTNPNMVGEREAAVAEAIAGGVLLIAWPGQWSTATFYVSDPKSMPSRR